ncbi:MAG: hypothetical protein AAGA84_02965 [Pseudomonadota bacterium]
MFLVAGRWSFGLGQSVSANIDGITVAIAPERGQRIETVQEPVAAFLGRATAGPVNQPIRLTRFADFERVFGPAGEQALALAVQQFFEHGGMQAVVVRLASGATAGTIALPTDAQPLTLRARNPGSAERLRVSVDASPNETDRGAVTLTVQRLDPVRGHIIDQEIHANVSMSVESQRFIANVLEDSHLVELADVSSATARPTPMQAGVIDGAIGYQSMSEIGTDGCLLNDYDLIGSDRTRSGLFALESVAQVDFVWVAANDCTDDPGPAFVVAAEHYCQQRNAILVLDPPRDCHNVAALMAWRQRQQHASAGTLTYFPGVIRRNDPSRVWHSAAGALIGMLCRGDHERGVWSALDDQTARLNAAWQAAEALGEADALQLLRLGVNPLVSNPTRRLLFPGLVTCANLRDKAQGSLVLQRLIKFILRQVDQGTRWTVFAAPDDVKAAVETQVGDFLAELAAAGAFRRKQDHSGWWVTCEPGDQDEVAVRIMLGFQPMQLAAPVMYLLTLRRDGTLATRAALSRSL